MCQKPSNKHGRPQYLHIHGYQLFAVKLCKLKMSSWKKASAAVGLAGLMPHEAAKKALMCEEVQNLPDPFRDVIMEVKVSILYYIFQLNLLVYIECVRHLLIL